MILKKKNTNINNEDNLEILEEKSDKEKQESAEQHKKQRRVGLKIVKPDQMFSRLPITLAQLKA